MEEENNSIDVQKEWGLEKKPEYKDGNNILKGFSQKDLDELDKDIKSLSSQMNDYNDQMVTFKENIQENNVLTKQSNKINTRWQTFAVIAFIVLIGAAILLIWWADRYNIVTKFLARG